MIDFPASPVAGQIFFASNGAVYQYNSTYTSWVQIASSVLQDGTFHAYSTSAAGILTTDTVFLFPTVLTGNVGGWFNPANGRFTPPAGRYFIYAGLNWFSSSASIGAAFRLRKNGVVIVNEVFNNSTGANGGVVSNLQMVVDANGTDYFEVMGRSPGVTPSGVNMMWFGAFPISQAAQIPGGGSSWRQIARTVVGAATPTLDFQNIPSDINDIEVRFDLTPVSNDVDLYMQLYDGSNTLLTGANYNWAQTMASHAQAIASAPAVAASVGVGVNTTFVLDYSVATRRISASAAAAGKFEINNIRAVRQKYLRSEIDYVSGDNALVLSVKGGGRYAGSVAVTGFRLLFSVGNIAAGGVVTLWGSP